MRKKIYSEIKKRILSVQDPENEQLFKSFGLWNEQTEGVEQEMPFQCPAVFIEFMPAKWRLKGNGIQETDFAIRLHVITEYDTEQIPDFFDIVDRVTVIMQNSTALKTDRRWTRSQSITVHNSKYCIDSIEEYVCNLQEFPVPPADMLKLPSGLQPNIKEINPIDNQEEKHGLHKRKLSGSHKRGK